MTFAIMKHHQNVTVSLDKIDRQIEISGVNKRLRFIYVLDAIVYVGAFAVDRPF